MKYFLIGFAIWFFIAFGIQFIHGWILEIGFQWRKKHASKEDGWLYK